MNQGSTLFDDGAAYERMMGRWSRMVGEKFVDWLGLPRGLRYLDVGCGNGAFTEVLIARAAPAAVTAVDPSEEQVGYARQQPGAASADFRIGDAQSLPFADGTFDAALMALVIVFVPDAAKAIQEMARVVRPGGWVATYMWDIPGGGVPLHPVYEAVQSLGLQMPLPRDPEVSRRETLDELWRAAGLESIETGVIRIPTVYANFEDFWDSNTAPIGPQGKAIAALSDDQRQQVRAWLRQRLPAGPDGRIVYEGVANTVRGRVPG